jgi:hypothetical protein
MLKSLKMFNAGIEFDFNHLAENFCLTMFSSRTFHDKVCIIVREIINSMKSLAEFKMSLERDGPDSQLPVQLRALWYDARGDWDTAHNQVDHLSDPASARIHAYLHRKEGDIWNADYWYAKAGESRPQSSLDEEWGELVLRFL